MPVSFDNPYRVHFDYEGAARALEDSSRRLMARRTEVLRRMRARLARRASQAFLSSGQAEAGLGPEGEKARAGKWTPIAESTKKSRRLWEKRTGKTLPAGDAPLRVTDGLFSESSSTTSAVAFLDEASGTTGIGTSRDFGRYLQEGTEEIPARPFLVAAYSDIAAMERDMSRELLEESRNF